MVSGLLFPLSVIFSSSFSLVLYCAVRLSCVCSNWGRIVVEWTISTKRARKPARAGSSLAGKQAGTRCVTKPHDFSALFPAVMPLLLLNMLLQQNCCAWYHVFVDHVVPVLS